MANVEIRKLSLYHDERLGKVAIKGEIRNVAARDYNAVHFMVIVRRESVGVAVASVIVYGLPKGYCKPFSKALEDLQKGPVSLKLNFTPKFETEVVEAY